MAWLVSSNVIAGQPGDLHYLQQSSFDGSDHCVCWIRSQQPAHNQTGSKSARRSSWSRALLPSSLGSSACHQQELLGSTSFELGSRYNAPLSRVRNHQLSGMVPLEMGQFSALDSTFWYNVRITGSVPTGLGLLLAKTSSDAFGYYLLQGWACCLPRLRRVWILSREPP